MSKYIVGVDGGGTNTVGVLFDENGLIIKRVENGFSNFSVDEMYSRLSIMNTLDQLVEGIDIKDILQIQMGIAGVSKFSHKDQFTQELIKKYKTNVDIVTDAEIALYSIKKDTDNCVIMVLGGTGSAIMLSSDKKVSIIGGFGHILGDEGSAYHLAISALKEVIRQYEEACHISVLSKEILKEIGADEYFDIKHFVYNKSKSDIAALSQFISKYALEGNTDAIELFKLEGIHLARQTVMAYNKLQSCKEVVIGIRGGFLLNAPYVKETLIQELAKSKINYIIDATPGQPIYGAYYLGKKHINKR